MKTSVIQDWVAEQCTWKQQAVLLTAIRGCDGVLKEDPSKAVVRQFRQAILRKADNREGPASGGFMTHSISWDWDQISDAFLENMDHYPMHWLMHFAHACEIVGYKHPQDHLQNHFSWLYLEIVRALHLQPETEKQLDARLRDYV